jgi:hypothetical protein
LPGSLARQSCPAVLPGSLARQIKIMQKFVKSKILIFFLRYSMV